MPSRPLNGISVRSEERFASYGIVPGGPRISIPRSAAAAATTSGVCLTSAATSSTNCSKAEGSRRQASAPARRRRGRCAGRRGREHELASTQCDLAVGEEQRNLAFENHEALVVSVVHMQRRHVAGRHFDHVDQAVGPAGAVGGGEDPAARRERELVGRGECGWWWFPCGHRPSPMSIGATGSTKDKSADPMFDLQRLQIFRTVATLRSFSAASSSCRTPSPASWKPSRRWSESSGSRCWTARAVRCA